MKKILGFALLLSSLPFSLQASAATYTVTANNVTMHRGDPMPPLTFTVSEYAGAYSKTFKGQPELKSAASSTSAEGTYSITIDAGSGRSAMGTINESDRITFVPGSLRIIADNGIGARLSNGKTYPAGFFTGPAYPMINVKSNPIANLVGDGVTDDTRALQALLAWGRDSRRTSVITNGPEVTGLKGTSFIGLSGIIQINGLVYTIASVTDATHLTLTTSAGSQKGANLRTGGNEISSDGTTITALSGPAFTDLPVNSQVLIDGSSYQIASVADATHLTTKIAVPVLKKVKLYAGNPAAGWGRQALQLYFPASSGCYLVSDQLTVYGNYFTFIGDGAQTSCLRLASNSAAFNRGTKRYLLGIPSNSGNENFREIVENLGLEVGVGNPDAEAIHWVNNNMGVMRNVQISNDDSSALYGIGLEGAYPGPTMFKNVAVYGFQYGIYGKGQGEYNVTMEGLTTEGQRSTAIVSGSVKMSIRHWTNESATTALATVTAGSNIAIIDSELYYHGNAAITGITNFKDSHLFGRSVKCVGYNPCEMDSGTGPSVSRATLPPEFWTGAAQCLYCSTAATLNLPEAETPEPKDGKAATWTRLGDDPGTWASTIATSSSPTVYLPPGSYAASSDPSITVPDTVNHIQMYSSQFNLGSSHRVLYISVAGSSHTPLVIDGCLYQACYISHTGTRTLVLKDGAIGYQGVAGAGNVFFEDVGMMPYNARGYQPGDGPTFYSSQSVWARQFDIETGDPHDLLYPKLICNGCKLWILGYKTEQNSPSLILNDGAKAEIFGFFYYQLHLRNQGAGTGPMYVNDSSLFATGFIATNAGIGAPCWVVEKKSGKTDCKPTPNVDTPQSLNFYYSNGASNSAPDKR